MSEYQYYDFLAVDRPLIRSEMTELRKFSTRAEIGPTSFVNEYHFGSFKGDPVHFLTHYFDAFVYTANWGTRQFMFRVPRDLVDLKTIKLYCTQTSLNITPAGGWLIIDMTYQPDEGGYDDGEGDGWMASLIGIRSEVIAGDYRPLYLAWLLDLQWELIDSEDLPPPVPAGLGSLSAAQNSLVRFLGIDEDLIELAASDSAAATVQSLDLATLLSQVPTAEKDRWLMELIETDGPHAALRLRSRLMALAPKASTAAASTARRSPGELLETWKRQAAERAEQEPLAAEAKQRKKAADAAATREKHLDQLAKNLPGAWRNLDQMIGLKSNEGYRRAIELLKDLKALDDRPGGDPAGFRNLLMIRSKAHAKKTRFITMLRDARLL